MENGTAAGRTRSSRWRRTLVVAAILATLAVPDGRAVAVGGYGSGSLLVPNPETMAVDEGAPFALAGATAIPGRFIGDTVYGGTDDILWYTPGPGGDALWESRPGGTWRSHPISIDGRFEPVVGSFTDGVEQDILWYAPGPHPDELWDFTDNGTITKKGLAIDGDYQPVVGRFTQVGRQDILWYAPGAAPDAWWSFGPGLSITSRPLQVNGRFTPLVGSFGCRDAYGPDSFEDVFWYSPGPGPDAVWDFGAKRTITKTPVTVDGTYTPVPGAFTDDQCTDIIWYAPGRAPDHLWDFEGSTAHPESVPLKIDGRYRPVAGNLFPSSYGFTDVLWFGPGTAPDVIWDFTADGEPPTDRTVEVEGTRTPLIGFFTAGHMSILDRTT
ncbi:MAG: hypothetical protein JWO77_1276 [Ilumatobacteraceae bacterium]|nr:hypothetical protein [Ilumatobacteraceae bacterium]